MSNKWLVKKYTCPSPSKAIQSSKIKSNDKVYIDAMKKNKYKTCTKIGKSELSNSNNLKTMLEYQKKFKQQNSFQFKRHHWEHQGWEQWWVDCRKYQK